jgi:hypothetical protein
VSEPAFLAFLCRGLEKQIKNLRFVKGSFFATQEEYLSLKFVFFTPKGSILEKLDILKQRQLDILLVLQF